MCMRGIFETIFLKDLYQIINLFLDCYQIKYGSNDYSQIHFFFFKSWRYNLGVGRFWQENFEFGTF